MNRVVANTIDITAFERKTGTLDTRFDSYTNAQVNRTRILLIDDDLEFCALMDEFFAGQDIELEIANDGGSGLTRALNGRHEILLLDVMMPVLNGFELLNQLRRQSLVPVIMLTARTAQTDRIKGLNAGADDYLPKPFDPDELLARIRAVLRRFQQANRKEERIEVEGIILIPSAREVWCDGISLAVTTLEFEILELLARSAGRIVSREELTSAIYRRRLSPFDRAIDVHVSRLRKKLGKRGSMIQTVRGIGFLYRSGSAGMEVL